MNDDIKNFIDTSVALSIEVKQKSVAAMLPKIDEATQRIIDCLQSGGKILACGNGGSACDAEHLVCELVNKLHKDRGTHLPAVCLNNSMATLTSVANDYGYDYIFAKQIIALGNENDVMVIITTSGKSPNILRAYEAAKEKGMKIIALNGRDGGKLASLLDDDDIELRTVPEGDTSMRIQETHIFFIHIICALIDKLVFKLY